MARCVQSLQSLLSGPAPRALFSLSPWVQSGGVPGGLRSRGFESGPRPPRVPGGLQSRGLNFYHVLSGNSEGSSPPEDNVTLHFVNQDGVRTTTSVTEGVSLLNVVINKKIDISGFGACDGTLACSTCHLIFEENIFEKMDPLADEELDMLDLAYGLTKTSRLGCQVCVRKWMDGMTVRVPKNEKMASTRTQ